VRPVRIEGGQEIEPVALTGRQDLSEAPLLEDVLSVDRRPPASAKRADLYFEAPHEVGEAAGQPMHVPVAVLLPSLDSVT
jgi:hypothetical protein